MRLSERDKRILAAVEFKPDQAIGETSKEIGIKPHIIRDTIKKLIDSEIIRYYPFINVYPLGFQSFPIYLSLSSEGTKRKEQLMTVLKSDPRVSWIAEVGGDFQFCISVLARDIGEVNNFLAEVSHSVGEIFAEKQVTGQVSLTLFQAKYLLPEKSGQGYLRWGITQARYAIDSTESRILTGLFNKKYRSRSELAKSLGLSNSALTVIINKLINVGVIGGFVYLINEFALGMLSYKILVGVRGLNSGMPKRIFDYSHQHPNVTTLLESIGKWDYELGVEVQHGSNVINIVNDLKQKLGSSLHDVRIIPVLGKMKEVCFPTHV